MCLSTKPRKKDISNYFREAPASGHQPGKSYKSIRKEFEVDSEEDIHIWKTFKTVPSFPRS